MFFLTGGPMGGGGAGMLARLGAKQFLMNGARTAAQLTTRVGTQAIKNFAKSGLRNAAIESSTQLIFNGGSLKDMDILDIAISSVSGNSFVLSDVAGGFFDYSKSEGYQSGFDKGFYKTSVDIGTGVFFGGANHVTGMIPGSKNTGSKLGFGLDFTIDLYGGLFNFTLSGKPN
ncbi:MAG: hypothetical protein DYG99_14735 [Bacteroidetes bacterium CHB5]|nr:hypothetical protein [Bacteroidetes bacterium CHB5]